MFKVKKDHIIIKLSHCLSAGDIKHFKFSLYLALAPLNRELAFKRSYNRIKLVLMIACASTTNVNNEAFD